MDAQPKTRNVLEIILSAIFLFHFLSPPAFAKYGGGTGEPNDPYLIYTAEQMNTIGTEPNDWDKHFRLMADIDLARLTGAQFNIIGIDRDTSFTGVFDGNGHTISNFTYYSLDADHVGLFGYIDGPETQIKDLGLIDANVDAGEGQFIGSLAGELKGGVISGCFLQGGMVSGGEDVGGLVGHGNGFWLWEPADSKTVDCYAITNVIGIERVGGLVGSNEGTTISSCYSTGSVSGVRIIGGLVGQNGNWYSGREGGLYVGGFIDDCYSKCDVMGVATVGGLVGFNYVGDINRCYSSGAVLDSEPNQSIDSNEKLFGGLVADSEDRSITDCFWDVETSGMTVSSGGTGKTTTQMQTANTFISWRACGSLWTIDEGRDYPHLAWENMPGELITGPVYGGGAGTSEDPYLIYTAEQLNSIGLYFCHWDKHFRLMADIDMSQCTDQYNIIGIYLHNPFTGVFDGNGHTISNLTITGEDGLGLFGRLETGAEVRDLGVVDVNIIGSGSWIGAIAGYSNGDLIRCYSSGMVSGYDRVGGLVGSSWDGLIADCHSMVSVSSSDDWTGGLVGINYGDIIYCYSTGTVVGVNGGRIGGLVGDNDGYVINCYSSSDVSGKSSTGGLVGLNDGDVIYCCSTGTVNGGSDVGGLVGLNGSVPRFGYSEIIYCYSTASVSGDSKIGGLVGRNQVGKITRCYSTGLVSGQLLIAGFVSLNWSVEFVIDCFWDIETSGLSTSVGGIGKTTAEMQTADTFLGAGWDFVDETENGTEDIWWIDEGRDYPRLWWEQVGGY